MMGVTEPVLLYNLARAYEALGKWTEAADAYVQYLEEEPNAADRKALEGKVTTLRAQAAELAAARKPEPTTPPPPPPPKNEEAPEDITRNQSKLRAVALRSHLTNKAVVSFDRGIIRY